MDRNTFTFCTHRLIHYHQNSVLKYLNPLSASTRPIARSPHETRAKPLMPGRSAAGGAVSLQ